MTSGALQRRHDEDVISLGDRVADELLRISLADEVVQLPVADAADAPITTDAVEVAPGHTGTAYGCPVCAEAARA